MFLSILINFVIYFEKFLLINLFFMDALFFLYAQNACKISSWLERTRYLKENPKGVSEMCRKMEDMRNEALKEGIKEGAINTAKKMLEAGKYAFEEIANISGLSLEEVKKLKAE